MVAADTERQTPEHPVGVVYDAFLSYSHAADDLLAPRLQAGLQRFAKPWWKRRALRIFRDEASLTANPHLWASITEALDRSDWFVLLLSPEAASSPWVNREVEYWLDRKQASRILPVVTDGFFGWENGGISPSTDSAPPALSRAFAEEPRWVDLRWAGTDTDLDLRNTRFRAAVADVASAIRGVPKDELESEEVRQHRRTIRTAYAAGISLALLVVFASAVAVFAVGQRNEAVENARVAQAQALAAASVANLTVDPERSLLLALEAARLTYERDGTVLREAVEALHGALLGNRLEATLPDSGRGAFSPDGKQFIAGDHAAYWPLISREPVDGRAVAWEVEAWDRSGDCCEHIPSPLETTQRGTYRGVIDVGFSGDGRFFVTFGGDDRVRVWEAGSGSLVLEVPQTGVVGAALSPDGSLVAAISFRGWVNVWEVATGERAHQVLLPDSAIAIAFSPDGSLLAVAEWFGPLRIFEVTTWAEQVMARAGSFVCGVAFGATNRQLATGGVDGEVVIWDLQSQEQLRLLGHADEACGVDFSRDGQYLASGSLDGTARVWDAETGDLVLELVVGGLTDHVAFSPDGSLLAAALYDGTTKIWDISSQGGGEVFSLSTGGPVGGVAFGGPDILATREADDGVIRVWQVSTKERLVELQGGVGPGRVTYSADGSLLGAPGPDNRALIWDARTGETAYLDVGDVEEVHSVAFSNDGRFVLTTSADGYVGLRLRDPLLDAVEEFSYFVEHASSSTWTAEFSPDDQLVLSAGGQIVQLSEVPTGRAIRRFQHESDVRAAVLSPDAARVATAAADGTATLWNVERGEPERTLSVAAVAVNDVEFSPDGSRLATASADGAVKLWDVASGAELLSLTPHVGGVADVAFAPDGRYLATAGTDGTVHVIVLEVDQLVELAESRVTRSLTEAECQRYLNLEVCPGGG